MAASGASGVTAMANTIRTNTRHSKKQCGMHKSKRLRASGRIDRLSLMRQITNHGEQSCITIILHSFTQQNCSKSVLRKSQVHCGNSADAIGLWSATNCLHVDSLIHSQTHQNGSRKETCCGAMHTSKACSLQFAICRNASTCRNAFGRLAGLIACH